MKKTTLALLLVFLLLGSVLALSACKKDYDELSHDSGEDVDKQVVVAVCNHNWLDDNSVEKNEPTCVTAGVQPKRCSACGAQNFEELPATGEHSWQPSAVTKQPTCLEVGKQIYACSTCDEEQIRDLERVDHNYGAMHAAVSPTCVTAGNVAYKQCSMCGNYFDENGELIGDSADDLAIPATSTHIWNTQNLTWIWADTYDEFLVDGVKVNLPCSVCTEFLEISAVAVKDEVESFEPTYTQQGSYVFTAAVTIGETTLEYSKSYAIPVLPDGRPDYDYLLVGSFAGENLNGNSKTMTWNVEEQVFETEQAFTTSQSWKIQSDDGLREFNGNDIGSVTYNQGLTQPSTALYTVVADGSDAESIKMSYDCTLIIKLDLKLGAINVFVVEIDDEVKELECWFVGGLNAWSTDDPDYKFNKQADGTYTLTVTLVSAENDWFRFRILYGGVCMDDVELNVIMGESGIFVGKLEGSDGVDIVAGGPCTLNLTYDPATNTLTVEVLDD